MTDKQRTNDQDAAENEIAHSRRNILTGAASAVVAGATAAAAGGEALAATKEAMDTYADPAEPALPDMDMQMVPGRTALVVVDPQVDFLDQNGVA